MDSNTAWAESGIVAVLDPQDNIDAHVQDTLTVGDGLYHPDVVTAYLAQAPAAVRELRQRHGVRFNVTPDGEWALAREGGALSATGGARQ